MSRPESNDAEIKVSSHRHQVQEKNGKFLPEEIKKYFIALLLPEKIKKFQEDLELKIFRDFNLRPLHFKIPPHLTLKSPFDWPEDKEEILKQVLQEKAEKSPILSINLSNFGQFGRRTIFIRAKYPPELKQSVKKMQNRLGREGIEITESDKKLLLHSSVARFLKPEEFYQVWPFIRQFSIKETIEYNHFALLKNDGEKWQLSGSYPFND